MPIYKDGSKIKAIYKGDTPIKKVYHGHNLVWKAKESFQIIGTLTNNNGIYSGFGDYSYIRTPEIKETNIRTYEQVVVFKTPPSTVTKTTYVLGGDSADFGANVFYLPTRSRIMVKVMSGSVSSGNVYYEGASADTWYGVKLDVNVANSDWNFYISTDLGATWNQFEKRIVGVPTNINQRLRIGRHYNDGYPYYGEIDMNRSYIKVNGVNLW